MALRDRMRLKTTVPELETSTHCYVRKYTFLGRSDHTVDSP